MLTISVVIPSLNSARTLAHTLLALQRNSVKPEEILVIDGMSEDETISIARRFGCVVVTNPLRHTAAARQQGFRMATGEIVAMTDADCVPNEDWVERVRDHFSRDPKLDGVGGPVHLDNPDNQVQAYCAHKATVGVPEQMEIITRKGMRGRFSGANCAYRRQLVLDIGGYDYRFQAHGEDIDLFWRLVDRKARLLFDPTMSVEHLGFAQDLPTLASKSFGYGTASARLDRAHFRRRGPSVSLFWKPWSSLLREILRRDEGRYPACALVDHLMFALGRTRGALEDWHVQTAKEVAST